MANERLQLDPSTAALETSHVALSREDEASIRSLAEELHKSQDVVAEKYRRELVAIRAAARVTTFLPLVVSRLVRRNLVQG